MNAAIVNSLIGGDHSGFQFNLGFAVLLAIFSLASSIIVKLFVIRTNEKITYSLRRNLFSHIFYLDFQHIEKLQIGDSISRVVNDVNSFRSFFFGLFLQSILDIVSLIVVFVVLVTIDPLLSLLVLVTLPFSIAIGNRNQKNIQEQSSQLRLALSKLTTALQNWVSKAIPIKVYNLERVASEKFDRENLSATNRTIELGRSHAIIDTVNNFLFSIPNLIILGYGGYQAINGNLSVGHLFAFMTYTIYFLNPTRRLLNIFSFEIPALKAPMDRILEILKMKLDNKPEALNLSNSITEIDLKDICYNIGDRRVQVESFKINPGELIAITGKNGSGKSSLGKLLKGLYQPIEGRIVVKTKQGNFDSHEVLIENSIYLLQKPTLLSGTVMDNLTLFDKDPDIPKMELIVKEIGLSEWINKLPEGYNSEINDKTIELLSGGELQKINLVRALYSTKSFVLLDECEAFLEKEAKSKIISLVKKYCNNKIVVFITHSSEIVELCDKIIYCSTSADNNFSVQLKYESINSFSDK